MLPYLQELDDWVKSINKMIKDAKSEGVWTYNLLWRPLPNIDLSYWLPLPTL